MKTPRFRSDVLAGSMTMKSFPALMLACGIAGLASTSGCSSVPTVFGGSQPLPVERHASAAIEVARPRVTWRNGELEVMGYVTPRPGATTTANSHVVIELLTADGRVVASEVAEFVPRGLTRRLRPPQPHGRYVLAIAIPPGELARVRISGRDAADSDR